MNHKIMNRKSLSRRIWYYNLCLKYSQMLCSNSLVTSLWHYWQVVKWLTHQEHALEEDTEIFISWLLWDGDFVLLCVTLNRIFSLVWVQNNPSKWPWTATPETMNPNQSCPIPVGQLGYFFHRTGSCLTNGVLFVPFHCHWPSRKQNSIIAGTPCPNPLLSAQRMGFL